MAKAEDALVVAAYYNFGHPQGPRSTERLRAWFGRNCRDWKRERADDMLDYFFVLHKPMTAQKLRVLLATNTKNWGFKREAWCRENFFPMTIDEYGDAGVRIHPMMTTILQRIYTNAATAVATREEERKQRGARDLFWTLQAIATRKQKEAVQQLWDATHTTPKPKTTKELERERWMAIQTERLERAKAERARDEEYMAKRAKA
jgi:hypothetical protein